MDTLNYFLKYIKLDEEKRILISVQNQYESYLLEKESKKMILDGLKSILGEDFKTLEIGKNICRVTVLEGKEEESKEKIETELVKGLEMAMAFMSQMQNKDNQ
ncbi:hypothetical protein GOQ27_12320 [Clostridium sp. D2Q-11]|uniref:Uncharacterized protein n=1 Tax=Anaeromonas frigoriresistens TaxID=2683708 RepID=A0A942V3G8_9FIRM|nr:hypothetical protein [Anaeromonas frigoriresistens]MBS4539252.1 hypothetical protein [Anaeromonas frigoriresistens]